jgi:hypothetical protein
MKKFLQLVLTFDYKGKKCDMSVGCLPDFNGEWLKAYKFLDNDAVENPNTTPDGLLNAIKSYREGGIEACEGGFIVNDKCIATPESPSFSLSPSPSSDVLKSPVKAHIADPSVDKDTSNVSCSNAAGKPVGGKKHRTRSRRKTLRRTYRKSRRVRLV